MSKLNEDIIKALVPSKHMAVVIIILLLFLPAQHLFTIFFFFPYSLGIDPSSIVLMGPSANQQALSTPI